MAVGDSRFSKRASRPLGPTQQCQPFDVDLLCAKLEAAKLEQDAGRSRKYRPASSYGPPIAENYRISMPVIDGPLNFLSNEEITQRFEPERKRGASLVGSSKHGRPQRVDSRRSSTSHDDIVRPIYSSKGSKHKSVAFMGDVFVEEFESSRRSVKSPKTEDKASRRAKTYPLQISKLPLKHSTISTYDYVDSPDSKSTVDDTDMGMCNEYTISFDMADMLRDEYKQRDSDRSKRKKRESQARPQWADGLASRSLLNLSSALRKDRALVETEEIMLDEPVAEMRPLTSSNAVRGHRRQKSLPVELGNEELARLKKEQREKKRRTFIGFFKVF